MKYLILLFMALVNGTVLAQSPFIHPEPSDSTFTVVDRMPEVYGWCDRITDARERGKCSSETLYKLIREDVLWNCSMSQVSIQGTAIVSFQIDTRGKVINPQIVEGFDEQLNKMILSSIWLLPEIEPAKKDKRPVLFTYTMGVNFDKKKEKVEDNTVYVKAERMPVFKGECELITDNDKRYKCTQEAIIEFVQNQLEYPESAIEQELQGRVFVEFIVEKDGAVEEVKILKGVHRSLDLAAEEVVLSLPVFEPAKQRGRPVRLKYIIPVNFRLPKKLPPQDSKPTNNGEQGGDKG